MGQWGEVVTVVYPWLEPSREHIRHYHESNTRVGDDLNRVGSDIALLLAEARAHLGPAGEAAHALCESARRQADPERTLEAGVTGYVQFELEPRSHYQLKSFVRELGRTTKVVEPGRFRIVGTRTVYVTEAGDATCPYRGVLIGDLSDAPRPLFILAQCASLDPDASSGLALDLWRGAIHFSDADTERYRKISFQSMKIALDLEDIVYTAKKPRDYTLAELLDLKQRFARGQTPEIRGGNGERTVDTQIHRRFAFPMASMVLAVLAVPLGIRPLRTGRSAGAITAIGVMALYWCGFAAGELASERGLVPAWLGIWMPNVLVVALSIALIRATIRGDS